MIVLLLGSFLMVPLAVGVIFVPLSIALRSQAREPERTVDRYNLPTDSQVQRRAAREMARTAFADRSDEELTALRR